MEAQRLQRSCPRDHSHIQTRGKAATKSARYTDELVEQIVIGIIEEKRNWRVILRPMRIRGKQTPSQEGNNSEHKKEKTLEQELEDIIELEEIEA